MARKRKHISLTEKLAAALVMHPSVPEDVRNLLREKMIPAEYILAQFEWDHNILHSLGGSDEWWNLTPMLKREHRIKSRRDTSIAAKVKRVSRKHSEHIQKMGFKLIEPPTPAEKPKRKISSRPFPKRPK